LKQMIILFLYYYRQTDNNEVDVTPLEDDFGPLDFVD